MRIDRLLAAIDAALEDWEAVRPPSLTEAWMAAHVPDLELTDWQRKILRTMEASR